MTVETMGPLSAPVPSPIEKVVTLVSPATPTPSGVTPTRSSELVAGTTEFTITQIIDSERVKRRVLIHAPPSIDPSAEYPVVISFHGRGGNPDSWKPRLRSLIENGDFIGVYPEGYKKLWSLESNPILNYELEFVDEIIKKLDAYPQLSKHERYGLGTSNGAGIVNYLAIHRNYFRAITSIATQLIQGIEPHEETQPISVLQIHGMKDNLIPYGGGYSSVGLTFISAEESAEVWAMHNKCGETPEISTTDSGNRKIVYSECAHEKRILHYGITNAKHTVPKETEGDLFQTIWDFFTEQL
jgi:poly(3-hydroxybutyrate) depolymerase